MRRRAHVCGGSAPMVRHERAQHRALPLFQLEDDLGLGLGLGLVLALALEFGLGFRLRFQLGLGLGLRLGVGVPGRG